MGRILRLAITLLEEHLDIKIVRQDTWLKVQHELPLLHSEMRWEKLQSKRFNELKLFVLENMALSKAQLQQDLAAKYLCMNMIREKSVEGHFFVEIGANDGITLSNTYLLEQGFSWSGILCEANPEMIQMLKMHRKHSKVDGRAVDEFSHQQSIFLKTKESTYSALAGNSIHVSKFVGAEPIQVNTISATDLLLEHSAPRFIDYLSIDTEGNELQILQGLDFSVFNFGFITVEVSRNGKKIAELLRENGYEQILQEVSAWEQWWIKRESFSHK